VAQLAAVLGRQFSYELISAVTTTPKQQLDEALAQLVSAELIFRHGTPPNAEYTFKHALVQDAAYGTLLRSRRQQLHARVAETLERQFSDIVVADPALLAQHCAEAAMAEKAVVYRLKAGQQAMARSAMTEAVAQLQKGLDLLAAIPDEAQRRPQEFDLQIALGWALAATKGYAGGTVTRARALAEQMGRPEGVVPLIGNQFAFHFARSEHKLALSLAEEIEKIGEARNDVALQLRGRSLKGSVCLSLGEFRSARALLEQCHGLADPAHRGLGGGWPIDLYAEMLANLAITLTCLGYLDQGRLRLNEALSEATRLGHAPTAAEVLTLTIMVELITSPLNAQRHAEELMALATEHGFPLFLGWAIVFRGWSLTALGQAQEGLTLLAQGLAAIRATGAVVSTPGVLMGLAWTCAKVGRIVEAMNCLAEAAQHIETTEERVVEAELHRLRGELLTAIGDKAAANHSYQQAIAVAQRQRAKAWELRAATSLARLWRDQGKRTEARDLLAPIYGWFTEGFDTPVLQDAKALLDQLT
jgi:predicted ATPase